MRFLLKPKLSRCDTDEPFKVKGKLALVREPGVERNLCQLELIVFSQEVLCSLNAARDYILVRCQTSGRLELPGEVIGAEMGDRSHLP
jgi:hypothetical protein